MKEIAGHSRAAFVFTSHGLQKYTNYFAFWVTGSVVTQGEQLLLVLLDIKKEEANLNFKDI